MAEAEKILRLFTRNLSLLSRSRVLPLRSGHVEVNVPGGVSRSDRMGKCSVSHH